MIAFVFALTLATSQPMTFRPLDNLAAELLALDSDTLRALKTDIEQTDVHVLVSTISTANVDQIKYRSQVQLLTNTPANRTVHVRLRVNKPFKADLIAALAHELQHVLELARETHIHTPAAWGAHLQVIGVEGPKGFFETHDALRVERTVKAEFRR